MRGSRPHRRQALSLEQPQLGSKPNPHRSSVPFKSQLGGAAGVGRAGTHGCLFLSSIRLPGTLPPPGAPPRVGWGLVGSRASGPPFQDHVTLLISPAVQAAAPHLLRRGLGSQKGVVCPSLSPAFSLSLRLRQPGTESSRLVSPKF